MDPLTLIGVGGAVASLIDLTCRAIRGIREMQSHLQPGYLALAWLDFQSQLVALKAALSKIQDWLDATSAAGDIEAHHQLVMDMDMSMSCCRMLVGHLNGKVLELREKEYGRFELEQKIRGMMALDGKGIEDLRKMLDRQTAALTLLLVACSCTTTNEQKRVLEKRSSRHVFLRIRDDTSSLRVLGHAESSASCATDNLSKLSLVFHFDAEIFQSRVYERVMRGSMKGMLRKKTSQRSIKTLGTPAKFFYDDMIFDGPIPYVGRKDRREEKARTTLKAVKSSLINSYAP